MSPVILMNVTDDMHVMWEEIFAPILPVQTYDRIDDVIACVNKRPRPLAAYYFGSDRREEHEFLGRTHSGGVTVNDIAMHFLAEELPFGGIGASGMGAYHGEHGFQRFSHARTVVRTSPFDSAGFLGLRPPYGRRLGLTLKWLLRR
jgi:coniferyl-aldehyde dehydrogenase